MRVVGRENFKFKKNKKKCLTVRGTFYIHTLVSALVAQLDRATGYEPVGRAFESLQARQIF